MFVYHPHIPDNLESWQVFKNGEDICAFLHNEPLKPKEVISIKHDKFLKGLTPPENSFSTSDVGKKENYVEEESKRKFGNIVSVNIRTSYDPKILKIGS
jgi:hypothetical protein